MTRLELHDDFVRVVEADRHADFHLRWLWHNGGASGERRFDSQELPETLAIAEMGIIDGALRVTWRHDRRESRYPLAWLFRNAYAIDRCAVAPPPNDVTALELDGAGGPDRVAGDVLARLARDGAALVRRAHPDPGAEAWIAALEARGMHRIGGIEEPRTDSVAAGLQTHQPFLAAPPHFRLLHGIRDDDTILADGQAAFRYLASLDAEAAEQLVRSPVRFYGRADSEPGVVAPIVTLRGDRVHVRSSCFATAPFRPAFERVAAWYRALERFNRILRDPQHQLRVRIRPEDVLVYDNHRMLHAGARGSRAVAFEPGWAEGGDRVWSG